MMTPRHLAPAGAPIRATDLARWAEASISTRDASRELNSALRERFAVRWSFLASSGRAAFVLLLRAMKRIAHEPRDEVVLPSYTCYSVAASIVRAGLRPRIVDVSPTTLDYEPEELRRTDFRRVLAIVAGNLYGLPSDLPRVCELARRQRVMVIDDAAQAMGATVGGRRCGTWGDAGLFSFDKGKSVSAIKGGALVTNRPDLAAALEKEFVGLQKTGTAASGTQVLMALSSFVLLRPWLYWIPNSIPQLGLGRTVYSTDFTLQAPSRSLTMLGRIMLDRLPEFTAARRINAATWRERLTGLRGVQCPAPIATAEPAYLRFPMVVDDDVARRRALDRLRLMGIGASESYPASIADLPELAGVAITSGSLAGGRYLARHIVTLPTHPFVGRHDIARATAAVESSFDAAREFDVVDREGKSSVCVE